MVAQEIAMVVALVAVWVVQEHALVDANTIVETHVDYHVLRLVQIIV